MTYEGILDAIGDGDLIAVRSTHGGFPALVRGITGSPYTHCAVALWIAGGLWVSEMDGAKNVLVPLSQYDVTPFDVFSCPCDRVRVKDVIAKRLRGKVGYDWGDIIRIAAYFWFDIPLPSRDRGGQQCASYAASAYLMAGWTPARQLPSIPWPGAVVDSIGADPIVEFRP